MNIKKKLFDLSGKVALVTGATGYLGQAMCEGLADAGARVLVNARDCEKASNVVNKLRSQGYLAEAAVFDVTQAEQVSRYVAELKCLDILVNNAYSGKGGTIEHSTTQDFISSYEITVASAHRLIQTALPLLRSAIQEHGDASIINIGSMYGIVSPDLSVYDTPEGSNPPFYGTSKAALIQLSKYAAIELGKEGIRVNSLCPGPFPNMDVQSTRPDFVKSLANKVPLKRIGQASEIQGPLIFLASSASSFVSGATICVDGGWTAW